MKRKIYTSALLVLLAITVNAFRASAQVTVTSSDSINCSTSCTTLTANLEGDSPTTAGITSDDVYSPPIPIGFTFNFYGASYTQTIIGANGTLGFNLALAGAFDPYAVSAPLLGNTNKLNSICGPWCDIDIFYTGTAIGTETYSTDGVAPFRKFAVTWCNCSMFSCDEQRITTQIIIYETTNIIEVHIAHKEICTGWYSGHAIVGVQNAAGTAATTAPGRDYPSVWAIPPTEAWRFTPNATASAYTVASIPYAPIPYESSSLYWYNASTGAYLGTGATMSVCPTTTTTYKAGALGCSDTSFGYYTVTVAGVGPTPTLTETDPSRCGGCDGTITLHGLTPGSSDTINYTKDGVTQPQIVATVSTAGTVTINGLCAAVYSAFTVKEASCVSPPVGPITISNPTISISSVTGSDPTWCPGNDGTIALHGLYPGNTYTLTYTKDGVAVGPLTVVANASGNIVLSGLYAGVYGNFIATLIADICVTPAAGPYTLTNPPTSPLYISGYTRPTTCGKHDGTITIKAVTPFSTDTINYSLNGVAQPTLVVNANADSSISITGLAAGTYGSFTVKIGSCMYDVTGSANLVDSVIHPGFSDLTYYGCHGDTLRFSNSSYLNDAGTLYYVWHMGDGVTDTALNPVHIYPQGTYTVTLIVTNHYCIDSISETITLNHPLAASFTVSPTINCQGNPFTFTNSSVFTNDPVTGAGPAYNWSFGNGATDTAASPVYTYTNAGTYTVQLVVGNFVPCYDTATTIVQVDTISGINLTITDSVLCGGTYVTFQGWYASLGNTGLSWYFGTGDSLLNVNPVSYAFPTAGVYTVSATAHYRACKDTTATQVITVIAQPVVSLGADTSICIGSESLVLSDLINAGTPGATWLWNTGATTPAITIVAPGDYYVTVNVNNCYSADTVHVANDCYMNIPNVFSPNNDGVNDYFMPRQLLTKGLVTFSMAIYNRWGQEVFATTSVDGRGWDGRFNGVDQPEGVYVYVIDATFRDGQKEHHQGNITLIR